MKMVVFSTQTYDRTFLDDALHRHHHNGAVECIYHSESLSQQSALLAQGCDIACVFVNDLLDATVLAALAGAGVRAILLRCAGFNQLDIQAARALGLFVARVPAYSPEAVAEHTLALILTLNRHTHRAYARVREGNFMLDGLIGTNLHGKTVGLIGLGKIGMAVARIFRGFGCHLLGHDPAAPAAFSALGTLCPASTLLAESDIVSLHCPLMASTHHLIDASALSTMRRGAMLVNTSRGALVDSGAVIEALKSGQLGALAIDVYEQESELFFHDHSADIPTDDVFARLMTFPNVLVTGHQGFFTVEAMREIADVTMENLAAFMAQAPCANLVPGTAPEG